MKCLAEWSVADGQGQTESRNLRGLVDLRKNQLLGVFDKLPTRSVVACKGYTRCALDRSMNFHRTAPRVARHIKMSCRCSRPRSGSPAILSFGANTGF